MQASGMGDLPPVMAVLGLPVQRPDTAAGIAFRIEEQFPRAQFADNAAHNNLPRLAEQGLAELVAKGERPSLDRYHATSEGRALLRDWVLQYDSAPVAWRDALRGKLAFAEDRDSLVAVLREIREQEELCAREYGVAHRRVLKKRDWARRHSGMEWQARLIDILEADEARLWGLQGQRLVRLREGLEEVLMELEAGGAGRALDG
jgi:DNA-binding PadR family transcriptional regulator